MEIIQKIPNCTFRGQEKNGRFECSCPLMKTKPVSRAMCLHCDYSEDPDLVKREPLAPSKCTEIIEINPPTFSQKIKNFSKAVYRHAWDRLRYVPENIYKSRLKKCEVCPYRQEHVCMHKSCGCDLTIKASWNSETCPIGEWEEITEDGV
jgi:hypothetical protein